MQPTNGKRTTLRAVALLGGCLLAGLCRAGGWSGNIGAEWLAFSKDALSDEQHDSYLSVSFEPEYQAEWDQGRKFFTFQLFARGSQFDSRRSHVDIRELNIGIVERSWELTAGISKVYWGVTESQHLVDIINQTDLVENLDTEDKLGQPMINLALVRDSGTLNLFVLPGFRERTFAGAAGRPRFGLEVDQDNEIYESSARRKHVDLAARWFQYLGPWEIGISYFRGTSRTPELVITPTGSATPPVLTPVYHQIDQLGLEVQGTFGAWLWKLEAIHNRGFANRHYQAAVGGFEYTHVLESGMEVGALMEYSYDDRGRSGPTQFQNDMMLGTRITFNDVQSTQVLAGVIVDLGGGSRSYNLEAERRIGDSWKIEFEARGTFHASSGDFLYMFRRDNYVRLNLARYF